MRLAASAGGCVLQNDRSSVMTFYLIIFALVGRSTTVSTTPRCSLAD